MIYSYLDFGLKNSSFRVPYQHHSSTDCARELFKVSNRSASLLVCTWKKFFCWGVQICCEWCHKWSSFGVILAHAAWPRAQLLGERVSLKFSLETRLKSESFEPLISSLAFLGQKLWSKINKLIIWLTNYNKYFNTFAAGLIQAVRKKQLFRTWLCGWISPLLFALATRRKSQKTWSV